MLWSSECFAALSLAGTTSVSLAVLPTRPIEATVAIRHTTRDGCFITHSVWMIPRTTRLKQVLYCVFSSLPTVRERPNASFRRAPHVLSVPRSQVDGGFDGRGKLSRGASPPCAGTTFSFVYP